MIQMDSIDLHASAGCAARRNQPGQLCWPPRNEKSLRDSPRDARNERAAVEFSIAKQGEPYRRPGS